MNREAMKLLKIFDLDKEADYKASQLPTATRKAGNCPRTGHEPEAAAAGTSPPPV